MTDAKWTMYFEDERDMRLAVHAGELLEALRYYLDTAIYDPELVDTEGRPIPVGHWAEVAEGAIAKADAS